MTPKQYVKLMAPYTPFAAIGKDIPQALYSKLNEAWDTFNHTQHTFIHNALWAKHESSKKLSA